MKAKEKEKKKEKKKEKAKPKATNQFSEPAIMEPDEPPEYTPAVSDSLYCCVQVFFLYSLIFLGQLLSVSSDSTYYILGYTFFLVIANFKCV